MAMWIVSAFLCAAVLGAAGGCTPDPLHDCTVAAKQYYPEQTRDYVIAIPCGKSFITIPHTRHVPARWTITISGLTPDGETDVRTITVSQSVHNRTHVGDPAAELGDDE